VRDSRHRHQIWLVPHRVISVGADPLEPYDGSMPSPRRNRASAERRIRVMSTGLLVAFCAIVAIITFWPGPPDPDGQLALKDFLRQAYTHGLPTWITFGKIEFGANVVMFMPIGLFGASTGGGAALMAAAARPREIGAVVSRGGRPDLAGTSLARVTSPTLLIVGGLDTPVIEMNRDAMRQMHAKVTLEIVPGATHLFEEPGTLERVAELAGNWFSRCLQPALPARPL